MPHYRYGTIGKKGRGGSSGGGGQYGSEYGGGGGGFTSAGEKATGAGIGGPGGLLGLTRNPEPQAGRANANSNFVGGGGGGGGYSGGGGGKEYFREPRHNYGGGGGGGCSFAAAI